jgi:HD-GYP domain-containing protein (c-di-GMP phosphodiesterase class II)
VREKLTLPLAAVAASLLVPALVIAFFGSPAEDSHAIYVFHFVVVIVTTVLAAGAALWLMVIGARRADARPVLVGTAFSAMAALLFLHGLATPGVLLAEQPGDQTPLLAFAGGATLPVGGAILALAAWPAILRSEAVPTILRIQAVVTTAIVALGVVGMADQELLPTQPAASSPAALTLFVIGGGLLLAVTWRALRTFILTRRAADLLVVCGMCLLFVSLGASLTFEAWTVGWWAGHALELAGIAMVGIPVGADLLRAGQSRPLAGDLAGVELVSQEEAYLGTHVGALMIALAAKDGSTEGHTRRVAELAVRVGEVLGLAPHRLRALAIGGLMHDIGKLQIPDAILKKPGPLDDAEYEVVKHHPDWGDQLAGELGLSDRVRGLIRHHHERLDGTGYPDGRVSEQIDLDVRILAVCDVYDALISKRVYRDAWSPAQALRTLKAEEGTAFDGRCVAALEKVITASEGHASRSRVHAPHRSPLAHGHP